MDPCLIIYYTKHSHLLIGVTPSMEAALKKYNSTRYGGPVFYRYQGQDLPKRWTRSGAVWKIVDFDTFDTKGPLEEVRRVIKTAELTHSEHLIN